jgi:hypothetical protein
MRSLLRYPNVNRDDPTAFAHDVWSPLHGGNVSVVSRKGDVVKRQIGPASAAVHQLLRWLEAKGLGQVPRLLDVSATDEYLTYLPGSAVLRPWPEAVMSNRWLRDLGAWLRRYQGAAAGFRLAEGAAFLWGPTKPEVGMVVCHGDLGPWNCLHRGGRLTGVIDWDLARYGHPLDDVAELALEAVPLRPLSPGTVGVEVTKQSLRSVCRSYAAPTEGVTPRQVVDHVPVYLAGVVQATEQQAAHNVEPFVSFLKGGIVKELRADLAYVQGAWGGGV